MSEEDSQTTLDADDWVLIRETVRRAAYRAGWETTYPEARQRHSELRRLEMKLHQTKGKAPMGETRRDMIQRGNGDGTYSGYDEPQEGPYAPQPYNPHTSHCCRAHGCAYGDEDCPVETGAELQEYPCESCTYEVEQYPETQRRVIVQTEGRGGKWVTATNRMEIGQSGVYRLVDLDFEGPERFVKAYEGAATYLAKYPHDPLRVIEITTTTVEVLNPKPEA